MSAIKDVSGTAFVVAEFRAEENHASTPLYRDSVVALLLTDESRHAAQRIAAAFPAVKDMVKVRTRYFDDVLEKHLRWQVGQVVILGAGLDTRSVRKRSAAVTYFEIDDPATLKWKQTCYERAGVEVNVRFIPGNYVTDDLIALLAEHGFDFDLPTYFIWEGNVMYLPDEGVAHTLRELTRRVARFSVSFDYLADSVISNTTGDAGIVTLVESFAAMGARWRSGIRDIHGFALKLNLTVAENFTTAELHRLYMPGRPITSPIFDFYSVCTLFV
jgi:methyltransferase (TIGR00027 family)